MAFRIFPRYDKEGPGVFLEDIENRSTTTRFFQVLRSKFWRLCVNNLMYVIGNIPMIILSFLLVSYLFPAFGLNFEDFVIAYETVEASMPAETAAADSAAADAANETPVPTSEETAATIYAMLTFVVAMFIMGMCLLCVGPVQTSLSYLYRNYSREIPTFTWSDFKDSFRLNWKDSLKIMLINLIVTVLLFTNIIFYRNSDMLGSTASTIVGTIFTVALVFFLCMNIFVYPLLASLELKVKHIYKNSAIFFMSRFFPSLGIFILNVILLFVIPIVLIFTLFLLGFLIALVYYLFLAFALTHYLNSFFVWQQIDRFIIKKDSGKTDTDEEEEMASVDEETANTIPERERNDEEDRQLPEGDPVGAGL